MDGQHMVQNPTLPPLEMNINTTPLKSPKRGIIVVLISIVMVGLLAAGGVFTYTTFMSPAPETVMAKMVAELSKVKSFSYTGKIHSQGQISNPFDALTGVGESNVETIPTSIVEVEFSGKVDLIDKSKQDTSFKALMRPAADPENQMALSGDIRMIEGKTYFRVNQIPTLGFLDIFVAPIRGKWIISNLDDIKKISPVAPSDTPTLEAEPKQELTDEQNQQMQKAFLSSGFIRITARLKNDLRTYRYAVTMDKTALPKLMNELVVITGDAAPSENELKQIEKMFESFTLQNGELWVGRKDMLPYKYIFNAEYTGTEVKGKVVINATLEMNNYNKPVVIEAPESAKTLAEILEGVFGPKSDDAMMATTTSDTMSTFKSNPFTITEKTSDSAFDSDSDGLSDEKEMMYKTDPKKSDTDGDGYNDKMEIDTNHDPLKK